MKDTVQINLDEFQTVLRRWLVLSSQELARALNRRMFFLMVRFYVLAPPQNPQAKRDKIRRYMTEELGQRRFDKKTGKKVGKARALRRVHLITQALNKKAGKKGLYGSAMKKAAASTLRRAVGSVGYLKAPIVKAIRIFNGHFTQWGGRTRKANGKDVSPNAALIRIGRDYGVFMSAGNVGMFKGAKASGKAANPSWNPEAQASLSLATKSDIGPIESRYEDAMTRALADERAEMLTHISEVVDAAADQAASESPNGRAG